jgi:putative spermidine/putrescine transport system permease protein
MRMTRWGAALLLGIPTLFLLLFFVLPFLLVLAASLQAKQGDWTLAYYIRVLGDSFYIRVLLETFRISFWVTVWCLVFGYALAYFIVFQTRSRQVRRLIYIVLLTPLFISSIVRTFGWMVILGRAGLVNQVLRGLGLIDAPLQLANTPGSVVVGLAYILLPFMVLTVGSVLQNIDLALLEAARDLGANPIVTFLRVTLPLSVPGIVAGTLIVFTLSASAYVTPSVMSGGRFNMMSLMIFQQYMMNFDYNFGAALAVVLLAATLLVIGIYLAVISRWARRVA